MDAFAALKQACSGQDLVSFRDLPIGEYPVTRFSIIQTRFGPKVKADLGSKSVTLPNRFTSKITPDDIIKLNSVPQIMVYSGKDASNHDR